MRRKMADVFSMLVLCALPLFSTMLTAQAATYGGGSGGGHKMIGMYVNKQNDDAGFFGYIGKGGYAQIRQCD